MGIVRNLRRAFLSISRCGDVMFSPYRLTTDQYALMRAVQKNPGIRQSDLRDEIFAEPNTITAMVTLLERRGIVRRKLSPTDGRVRMLYLTPHGNAVINRLSADWEPMRVLLRELFGGEEGRKTLEILDRVYGEMQRERESLLRKANAFGPLEVVETARAEENQPEPESELELELLEEPEPVVKKRASAAGRKSKRQPDEPQTEEAIPSRS